MIIKVCFLLQFQFIYFSILFSNVVWRFLLVTRNLHLEGCVKWLCKIFVNNFRQSFKFVVWNEKVIFFWISNICICYFVFKVSWINLFLNNYLLIDVGFEFFLTNYPVNEWHAHENSQKLKINNLIQKSRIVVLQSFFSIFWIVFWNLIIGFQF